MNVSTRTLGRIVYTCLALNLLCGNAALLILWVTR